MAIRARMGLGWRIFWTLFTIAVFLGGGFGMYKVGKRDGIADAHEAVGVGPGQQVAEFAGMGVAHVAVAAKAEDIELVR